MFDIHIVNFHYRKRSDVKRLQMLPFDRNDLTLPCQSNTVQE